MSLVSVIIPSYQRFDLLLKSIESVQNQTHSLMEIIVIDDCSPDERYLKLGDMFKDDIRIKIARLDVNQRVKHNCSAAQGMTRNFGLKLSQGEYIAFLDDDDMWFPNKIEIQLGMIAKNPDCLLVATNMFNCTNSEDKHICSTQEHHPFSRIPGLQIDHNTKRLTQADIVHNNWFPNSSVMIHRSMYEKVGLQVLGINEDYEYWKRILQHTNGLFINIPLVHYDTRSRKFYDYTKMITCGVHKLGRRRIWKRRAFHE